MREEKGRWRQLDMADRVSPRTRLVHPDGAIVQQSKLPASRALYVKVKELLDQARAQVSRSVNTTMTCTYFQIGRMIVEDEQHGRGRAAYAEQTIKNLSRTLVAEYGKGFTERNLEFMRKFYLTYRSRISKSAVSESDGKGFLFAGRQVRFTFDHKHFRVDLVLYNRLLKSFVVIDLKIGDLTHQDLGQMQMYVNYYDRYVRSNDENKTIGIILCKDRNASLVEITLPRNQKQIFARKYRMYLPSKEDLRRQLEYFG